MRYSDDSLIVIGRTAYTLAEFRQRVLLLVFIGGLVLLGAVLCAALALYGQG